MKVSEIAAATKVQADGQKPVDAALHCNEEIEHVVNLTVEKFKTFKFQRKDTDMSLDYHLYIPEQQKPGRKYPLVLFMHDLGSCSDDIMAPLTQGDGAVVWAETQAQKRHPCFVLAPQYTRKTADDDYTVTWEADATIELIREIMDGYPVDERRIYGTGQSMGCMMLCELNIRYPKFFAGSFLVAGQWNPQTMAAVKGENLWVLVSQKDEKAFPIMGACMEQIRQAGGLVTEGGIDGKAPLGEQNQRVRELMSEGNHIFFTWYEGDSVLPEGAEVFPGAYHVNTWRIAYGLEAVRDWLFAQTRPDIDFSCKHEVMLRDDDGSVQPMDVPYFTSRQIAPGTWQILSDGDYSYLVEGETEALVIDSGYGCGNIRAYCQSLTEKPVRRIANTHDHFDHTANNSYFDCAYMSAETKELATLPFPSFQGITFPRDYPIEVIDEGYVFHLGGRDLRTFKIPDHAVGSLAFLDSREGILFCGDELCMPFGKPLNGSVQRFRGYLKTLQEHFDEMKLLAGGPGIGDRELIQRLARNMDYILAGHEGKCPGHCDEKDSETVCEAQQTGIHDKTVIYDRRLPHYPDRHKDDPADIPFKRVMEYAGTRVIYDIRKVYER